MSLFEGLVTLYLAKKKGKQQQQKHKAFVRVLGFFGFFFCKCNTSDEIDFPLQAVILPLFGIGMFGIGML